MPSHDLDTLLSWRGSTVRDRDGDKIGTLKELYLDQDDRPAWGAVDTGLFGLRQSFVPLAGATAVDDDVQVPFEKDHVKAAPNVDPDAQLSDEEERRLYRHYELSSPDDDTAEAAPETREARGAPEAPDAGETRSAGEAQGAVVEEDRTAPPAEPARGGGDVVRETDRDTGDRDREPETDRAPAHAGEGGETAAAVTRSEEEVSVGTRKRVRGKARLRKYTVTEHVQRTIPVQREEVRVEYEPAEGESEDEPADDRPGPAR